MLFDELRVRQGRERENELLGGYKIKEYSTSLLTHDTHSLPRSLATDTHPLTYSHTTHFDKSFAPPWLDFLSPCDLLRRRLLLQPHSILDCNA